jgi:hypothetical protein
MYRRAAYFVDRIFKGTKPADLPVEQAAKFDMILNLRSAKAIGLTIPDTILVLATEVIDQGTPFAAFAQGSSWHFSDFWRRHQPPHTTKGARCSLSR